MINLKPVFALVITLVLAIATQGEQHSAEPDNQSLAQPSLANR